MGLTPPPTQYAKSGDVHVAYQVTGAGEIDMIVAPGTVSHLGLDWERPERVGMIEWLSSFCRLIRFDKRGTGLSDRPLTVATLEQRTDDIRAVMEAAGSERAVLFGISEGASMACVFSATVGRELGLEVRAGVHTGEVERANGAVRGIAVHVAARVAGVAESDRVVVSSTVRDLTAGSGLEFEDAGTHELKGVPEPRRLFRLVT